MTVVVGESDTEVLQHVCRLVSAGDRETAEIALERKLPFEPHQDARPRRYTERQMLGVFMRDGFIDRYDGARLVFPPVLRTLSLLFPGAIPFHPNWKFGECHEVYWRLFPTVDHVKPVARGGADDLDNWVSTSMRNNSIKSHWTLDELKWSLAEPGVLADWDGLLGWFLEFAKKEREFVQREPYLLKWHRAALAATKSGQ